MGCCSRSLEKSGWGPQTCAHSHPSQTQAALYVPRVLPTSCHTRPLRVKPNPPPYGVCFSGSSPTSVGPSRSAVRAEALQALHRISEGLRLGFPQKRAPSPPGATRLRALALLRSETHSPGAPRCGQGQGRPPSAERMPSFHRPRELPLPLREPGRRGREPAAVHVLPELAVRGARLRAARGLRLAAHLAGDAAPAHRLLPRPAG